MNISNGWQTLHKEATVHTLSGGEWSVRGRLQKSASDRLWLNVKLPDGSWAYIVLESDGAIAQTQRAPTKRECWERTDKALRS